MMTPFIIEHDLYNDKNGFYCDSPLIIKEKTYLVKNWVRVITKLDNQPLSITNITYQEEPFEENRYFKVLNGKVYCMIICVDSLRPNYLNPEVFELNNHLGIYVPKGYAFGFVTVENNTITQCFTDNSYAKNEIKTIDYENFEKFNSLIHSLKNLD